jgi:hypothetical protein
MRTLVAAIIAAALLAGCSNDSNPSEPVVTPESDAQQDVLLQQDAAPEEAEAAVLPDAQPESGVYPCGTQPPNPDSRKLPLDVTNAAPDLELRTGSERIELYARKSSKLTEEKLLDIANRSCEALTFDLKEFAVSATEPSLAPAVRIIVLDDPTYDTATQAAGSYGVSYPEDGAYGDAVVVPESGLSSLVDFDDTLAHELTHIVHGRIAPNNYYVTWFLVEGTATLAGTQYGMLKHNKPTDFVKGYLVDATGADATLTFDRYGLEDKTQNMGEVGHDQALSAFFMEYLRVKHVRPDAGAGYPDVQARMLQAMIQVSDGADEPTGFAAHMDGLSEPDAQTAFTQWLDATVGNPTARFAGTLFE